MSRRVFPSSEATPSTDACSGSESLKTIQKYDLEAQDNYSLAMANTALLVTDTGFKHKTQASVSCFIQVLLKFWPFKKCLPTPAVKYGVTNNTINLFHHVVHKKRKTWGSLISKKCTLEHYFCSPQKAESICCLSIMDAVRWENMEDLKGGDWPVVHLRFEGFSYRGPGQKMSLHIKN